MPRTWSCLGALILTISAAASAASAQYPCYACPPGYRVPDACGPGYYNTGPCGMVYGPNYNLRPPCLPFNGLLPQPPWAAQAAPAPQGLEFPTHPYARGPRDFFMYEEPR